jgi:hypothetical protein
MSHDENPFNVITGFTFADANPYVPSYNPLPPETGPGRCIRSSVQEPESWATGSATSTITPPPRSSPIYREIRPRPAPTSPLSKTKNEEHKRQRGLQDGKHSERRVGRPTRKARRMGPGVTATTNQPAWRNKSRFASLILPTFIAVAK